MLSILGIGRSVVFYFKNQFKVYQINSLDRRKANLKFWDIAFYFLIYTDWLKVLLNQSTLLKMY